MVCIAVVLFARPKRKQDTEITKGTVVSIQRIFRVATGETSVVICFCSCWSDVPSNHYRLCRVGAGTTVCVITPNVTMRHLAVNELGGGLVAVVDVDSRAALHSSKLPCQIAAEQVAEYDRMAAGIPGGLFLLADFFT